MKKLLFKSSRNYEDGCLYQTYVQPTAIMFRVFVEGDAINSSLIEESELWTNDDLRGKHLVYNDKTFVCEYNRLCEVHPTVLDAYHELQAVITMDPRSDKSYADRMYIADRLGETYFSKYTAGHWAKHVRVFGGVWLYRWLIQPGTDLTTAPVLCIENVPLITNLEFDAGPYTDDGENWKQIIPEWISQNSPHVTIEGPDEIKPNETLAFTVRVLNHDGSQNTDSHTYLVDCKQGYAPSKEVRVEGGVGTVRITALGLDVGETLRFKINDAIWTSYAEKTITVVEN